MGWTKRSKIYCVVWAEVDFAYDKTLSVERPNVEVFINQDDADKFIEDVLNGKPCLITCLETKLNLESKLI